MVEKLRLRSASEEEAPDDADEGAPRGSMVEKLRLCSASEEEAPDDTDEGAPDDADEG